MRCDPVKRRRLWAGLGAAAVIAGGAGVWAVQFRPDATPHSGSDSASAGKAQRVDVLLQTGLVQSRYQDRKGAESTFRRVLELDSRNKTAWYNLGVLAHHEGRAAEARNAYDKALKIDPRFTSALFNEAVLLESSEPDRSVQLLRRAIAVNPKASTAHLRLGLALAKKDQDEKARDAFRRAVALDPSLHSQVPEPFKDSASPSPSTRQAGSTR